VVAASTTDELVYDPYDHATILDPHATFRRLREEAPLYYNEQVGFYAVSRFDDCEKVLLNRDTYISSHGVTIDMLKTTDAVIPPGTVIFEEPPAHGIHRSLLSRMFTPKRVSGLEPGIRDLCASLLDPQVGGDGFDFIADFGGIVPMRVISMLVGIPDEDQQSVRDNFGRGREKGHSGQQLTGAMFAEYIDWRVEHPSDDIMSQLLHAEFEDEHGVTRRLSRDEVLAYVNIVAAAGNETTRTLMGWAGRLLAEHPDQRARLVADPGLIPNAVEEILRYEPNTLQNCRYVARDVEVHGEVVPAGSIMATLTASAGRDERVYEDPDRFDVGRAPGQHLYFGFGAHYCLGKSLARLEGKIMLEEMLARFPEWDVHLDAAKFLFYSDMRSYEQLPITVG
jgi:cytochrome P450